MVTVQIGENQRKLEETSEQWIAQQIQSRRREGQPACIVVRINTDGARLTLMSADCRRSGGGGYWDPNAREEAIWDLWKRRGLNDGALAPGNLIAFLKQLPSLLP